MVITFPVSQTNSGLRRINPTKDFGQLVELLRIVFGQEAGGEGQFLGNVSTDQNQNFLWRFDPNLARLSPGFVWEQDSKIVGNATLLPSRPSGRYLVANVAVHPDYRRQGIARMLMNAVVEDVQSRQGREIMLQVVHDNQKAVALYRSMQFESLGSMSTWHSSVSRLHELPEHNHFFEVQPLSRGRWRDAYYLDRHSLDPNLNWPAPRPTDFYKTGIWHRFFGFFNGQKTRAFVTMDTESRLTGLVSICSEWGQPHEIAMRIHPQWQGQLELPLLNSAVRYLRYLARRNIRMIHFADDKVMNQLLTKANFRLQRTLTHMRLILK